MAGAIKFPSASPVVHADLSFNSSGDNTIISGVTGNTIRIVKITLGVAAGSSVTAGLYDGASSGGTARGHYYLGALVLDLEANPIIITAGNNFVINLSSGVTVKGCVSYVQAPTQQ